MDQGRLVIPRDSDLLRELAALRVELRPGGTEKIEAGRGHDGSLGRRAVSRLRPVALPPTPPAEAAVEAEGGITWEAARGSTIEGDK